MYITLTALWKFFYYSPKRGQSLKEVQKVLDLPELKIMKRRWACARGVCESYEG